MKIRNLIVLSFIGLFIGFTSCRDDFDYDLASDNLSFSNDTINLDTIFNHTNSQTYKLTVHNNQDKDVEIPKIYLSRGEGSFFKLNVDGAPGYEFENVVIRKKDSILIFLEIAAGEAPVNPLYEDEINFETTAGAQQVKLLSYIEKAMFYNTDQTNNFPLGDVSWNNEFSRVIFGKVSANSLNISHGTKIYFHNNAELTVNGNTNITGTKTQKVIFRTDRMDERSDSLPDMWGKIHLKNNSNSLIDHAIIKGGNIGLEVENSTLNISNTKILNNEKIGLYGKDSNITGYNLVINNSDLASLAIEGGEVEFIHSTFANYHNIGQGTGGNYSLYLGNVGENNNNIALTQANFFNCIFYGRASNAIIFENGGGTFNYNFINNIIRLDEIPNVGFSGTITEDPLFVDSGFGTNDLRLLFGSPAKEAGNENYNITEDILGNNRPQNPTLGAYQDLVNPETLD